MVYILCGNNRNNFNLTITRNNKIKGRKTGEK